MLTVHLHLSSGDVIELDMTAPQKNRVSQTMNLERLPRRPFHAVIGNISVEIPWRSTAYLPARPVMRAAEVPVALAV